VAPALDTCTPPPKLGKMEWAASPCSLSRAPFAARSNFVTDAAFSHQPPVQHDIATHPSVYPPAAVYVLCLLAGSHCSGVIALSPRNVKGNIAHHLSLYHGIPRSSASSAPVHECTWLGCGCALRGPRCGGRPQGHAAHIKDLTDHIMHSHLDFFYACDRCGRAEWATPYALSRHRQRCRGRVAARCTGCNDLLVSQSALASHVERKECSAAPV
jgi:hypothetical protein